MILDFTTYIAEKFNPKRDLKGVLKETDRHTFRKLLRKSIITFKFKKKDGTIRKAKGTLISKYLPALKGGSPKPEHQMVYFDLDKEHWRSFRSYSFIKILNIKTIEGTPSPKKHEEKDEEEETTKKTVVKKEEKKEEKKKELHKEHEEEVKKKSHEEHHDEEEYDEHDEEPKEKKEIKKEIKKPESKHDEEDESDDIEESDKDKKEEDEEEKD